jgi:alkylhydroperoxidase family enzyme
MHSLILAGALLAAAPAADDQADAALAKGAPAVPATRQDLKEALEASKKNKPRLPLPPLTEEERKKAETGDWSVVNNGRMRKHYLPQAATNGGFLRQPDPAQTLGYPFQTMLFWIISRGNNCTYCMGHQESKLSAAGLSDDKIAALDGAWQVFTPAEQAAFAFVKKLTFEPEKVGDADIDALRPHYNDDQILEIIFVSGNFNAMNRWTGALRIPQEDHREYLTPTSDTYRELVSTVAPLADGSADTPTAAPPSRRPALESRKEVAAAIEKARSREPRIPLLDESQARAVLPEGYPGRETTEALPNWVRLLARFPVAGPNRMNMLRGSAEGGQLPAEWKPQIAWAAARQDRAWYALAHAGQRLRDLGWTDDQIFSLDDPDSSANTPERRAVLSLTRKLTSDPARIEDGDIEALRAHFTDHQVAEIIHHVTDAAFFDRISEASGLPIESKVFILD